LNQIGDLTKVEK